MTRGELSIGQQNEFKGTVICRMADPAAGTLYGGEFDPATPFDDAILAARYLVNSTLVFVPGASHAAFTTGDCTRDIAYRFVADPSQKPALDCLAKRPAAVFPVEGLGEFLDSAASGQ